MGFNYKLLWPLLFWPLCSWAAHSLITLFHREEELTLFGVLLCAGIGFIPAAIITGKQIVSYYFFHDHTAASPMATFTDNSTDYQSPEKRRALYPSIPNDLKFDRPEGIILGKQGRSYVGKPISDDGHLMVIGGSGSGKSSCIAIPILLANPSIALFALDIKGELHAKTCSPADSSVQVISPVRDDGWSYDVFYRLHGALHPEKIVTEEMRQIAHTLISGNPGGQDKFWVDAARDMLTGLLVYYYLNGYSDFLDCVDQILNKNIQQQLEEILTSDKQQPDVRMFLNKFSTMRDDTIGGIYAEVSNAVSLFSTDLDLRHMLSRSYQCTDPIALNEGMRLFLHVPEEKLSIYRNMVLLMINQILLEMTRRPEKSSPVIIMIDELARILSAGRLSALLDAAATLRSRRVTLVLITQSIEALEVSYKRQEVDALLNNMTYLAVLSSSSNTTSRLICDRAGKYREKQHSYQTNGLMDMPGRGNVTFQRHDILEPSDLSKLVTLGEVVIISQTYGYMRCKKCPYYKDHQLYLMHAEATAGTSSTNYRVAGGNLVK